MRQRQTRERRNREALRIFLLALSGRVRGSPAMARDAGARAGRRAASGAEGRRYAALFRRPGCLRSSASSEGPPKDVPPASHLVVTVNGIVGSAENWGYAAKQLEKRFPDDVIVHCSECNHTTLTFDGVDVMGERLAKEVLSVVAKRPELKKISFLAHSLGGLIARYAIAKLFEESVKNSETKEGSEDSESEAQSLPERSKGKIAGLEPMNFITFATPHLGSRWHKQIPILRGSYALEKVAIQLSWIVGRTGKHLMLKDHDDGNPPLLLQMVNDWGDLKFMSALQSFGCLFAYSNIHFDFIVGWKTSSIRRQNELPKHECFMKNVNYPHVVYIEKPKAHNRLNENFSAADFSQLATPSEMEEAMIRGLTRVPWERVDVSFRKSKQRIFAHSTIQVKTYLINSDGSDVIFHMMDNILL